MVIATIVEHPALSQQQVDALQERAAPHGRSRPRGASCPSHDQRSSVSAGRGPCPRRVTTLWRLSSPARGHECSS